MSEDRWTPDPRVLAKVAAAFADSPSAEEVVRVRRLVAASGRHGGDMRGSSRDRARRTARLLREFGDGTTCRCSYCPVLLTAATLTQDKIFPGGLGGRYTHPNLLPACITCNRRRSDAAVREFIAECEAALAAARACLDRGEVSDDDGEWVTLEDVRETYVEDRVAHWWRDPDGTVCVADDSRGWVAVDLRSEDEEVAT